MKEALTGRRYFNLVDAAPSLRQPKEGVYPCPCCDAPQFDEVGTYDYCSVCDWQDDPVQELHPEERGGANGISLSEARANFAKSGVADPEKKRRNAKPKLP
jgi:hypothetical protein